MRDWNTAFDLAHDIETKVDELRRAWPTNLGTEESRSYWRKEIDKLEQLVRGIRAAAGAGVDIEAQRRRDEDNAECATGGTCEPGAHHYTWPCELAPGTGRLWKEFN